MSPVRVLRPPGFPPTQGSGNSLARIANSGYIALKFLIVMSKGGPARTRSFLLPTLLEASDQPSRNEDQAI